MCKFLIGKNNIEPHIADEDISVLKAVVLNNDNKTWSGVWQSEYSAPVNTLITAEGNDSVESNGYSWICFKGGYFHSWADFNSIGSRLPDCDCIVEAIIPKGSTYYRSKVGNDFCSKQIIVTDKIVYKHGDDIEPLLKHPDVLEIVEKDGEKWFHVKDCEHEVYFATKSAGKYSWYEAIDMDMDMPSTDDFDLIVKYKGEIDGFCEEEGIEVFDDCYWSSGEYSSNFAWAYYGSNGRLDINGKSYTYSVRPVLAQKVES